MGLATRHLFLNNVGLWCLRQFEKSQGDAWVGTERRAQETLQYQAHRPLCTFLFLFLVALSDAEWLSSVISSERCLSRQHLLRKTRRN